MAHGAHLLLAALLTATAGALCLLSAYLVLLTAAAALGRRARRAPLVDQAAHPAAAHRFAILVPAHDEALLIGRLLRSLHALDYPKDAYDVYVVADNCTDGTAAIARSAGAHVLERQDEAQRGKGHALRWLLERIPCERGPVDAYVVLDADSVVSPNFLRSMDARLAAGSQVVQAYYSVLNAQQSSLSGLRQAALAAVHYLRPLGRATLGLSCGLKGNGMCFAAPVLERYSWSWFTLAEDVEFHLALVRDGIRVDFAPEAEVQAEMPVSFAQAASQNARWERGRIDLLRTVVPALLLDGLRRRSWLRLDAALEQCIPPLSAPFALAALCLVCGLAAGVTPAVVLAACVLAAQGAYLVAGLMLAGAPAKTYVALAYAPAYIGWKVALYAQALVGAQGMAWVRTARVSGGAPASGRDAEGI